MSGLVTQLIHWYAQFGCLDLDEIIQVSDQPVDPSFGTVESTLAFEPVAPGFTRSRPRFLTSSFPGAVPVRWTTRPECLRTRPPMIVTSKGELIAYPGFTDAATAPEKTLAEYQKKFALTDLAARISKDRRENGVIDSADGSQIVAEQVKDFLRRRYCQCAQPCSVWS